MRQLPPVAAESESRVRRTGMSTVTDGVDSRRLDGKKRAGETETKEDPDHLVPSPQSRILLNGPG